MRLGVLLTVVFTGLIFCIGCDTHCISDQALLWEPAESEFRLELTNRSPFMVELFVSDESVGVYCSDVEQLPIGNFPKDECSEIRAEFFDNPSTLRLDDCTVEPEGPCEANNTDGRTCYDTTVINRVEAVLD